MISNATGKAVDTAPIAPATSAKPLPKTETTSAPKKSAGAPAKALTKPAVKRVTKPAVKEVGVAQSKAIVKKVAAPSRETPKATATKATKKPPQRPQKVKMVRDSFTFPDVEHKRLVETKKRLIALGTEVKKGELVRAGLELLAALDNQKLLKAVAAVDKLKTGRPKK
jgi:hypothetical protein